jgi:hypothetical protein
MKRRPVFTCVALVELCDQESVSIVIVNWFIDFLETWYERYVV